MKSVTQIFESYPFTQLFLVKYALACCDTIKHLITDQKSIEALELTRKWTLDPKSVSQEELDYAASTAGYAYRDAYALLTSKRKDDWTRALLIKMIETEMSQFEQVMILNGDDIR